MRSECPNCRATGLETVYEVENIPVHSCILVHSREKALDFPTGNLALGWCGSCGFATNRLFELEMNDYNPEYEEVQTFSPTFNSFSASLVDRLIEKDGLRGKTIIEIGCGKGEFLLELCERGDNRGFGIDPSFRPGRGQWEPKADVQFFAQLSDAGKHGALEAAWASRVGGREIRHQSGDFAIVHYLGLKRSAINKLQMSSQYRLRDAAT